jgi:hypothetical protein
VIFYAAAFFTLFRAPNESAFTPSALKICWKNRKDRHTIICI